MNLVFRLTTSPSARKCTWFSVSSHDVLWEKGNHTFVLDFQTHHITFGRHTEITLLDLVFLLSTSHSQEYWNHTFVLGFPTLHITSAGILKSHFCTSFSGSLRHVCEHMEIILLEFVFRFTSSRLQNANHNFGFSFQPDHVSFCEQMDLLFTLISWSSVGKWRSQFWNWFSDSPRDVSWANVNLTFGLGFPTHRITSAGLIMGITLLELVFRLTTLCSVDKRKSHFWTWFSDSRHYVCGHNYRDHTFGIGFQTRSPHYVLWANGNHTFRHFSLTTSRLRNMEIKIKSKRLDFSDWPHSFLPA